MGKGIFALECVAAESIKYQGTDFLDELASYVKEIRKRDYSKLKDKDLYLSKPIKDIVACIKKHTNLNVTVSKIGYGAAAYFPTINNNDILIDNDSKVFLQLLGNDLEKDLVKASELLKNTKPKGSVNLKDGTVDGIYAKLDLRLLISKDLLLNSKKYSELEAAAVLLHEVGHLFTHIEYTSRMTTTNQVMALALKTFDDNISSHTKEVVYGNIQKKISLSKEELSVLEKSSDKSVTTVVILNRMIEQSKSELGNVNVYDTVSSEQLADDYANRHGAGKHLVTAIEKLKPSTLNKVINYSVFGAATFIIFANPTMLIPVGCYILLVLATIDGKAVYDTPASRYTRIKQSNIQVIKDKDTSDVERAYLLEQNDYIDSIVKTYNDNKSLLQFIAYWTKPGYKKAKDYEDLQKGLEKLTNNNLFSLSEKLKKI